jgi:hypothetical protein
MLIVWTRVGCDIAATSWGLTKSGLEAEEPLVGVVPTQSSKKIELVTRLH